MCQTKDVKKYLLWLCQLQIDFKIKGGFSAQQSTFCESKDFKNVKLRSCNNDIGCFSGPICLIELHAQGFARGCDALRG